MPPDYYGLPTGTIANEHLRVEYLAAVGPRIVRLLLAGHEGNLLAETPDAGWPTPFGPYRLHGGHRLWHAPEGFPRSSIPDDGPLIVEELPSGARLAAPPELHAGIRKIIDIELSPDRPAVHLRHQLVNEGLWPVELAPWAITQLPLGGVSVLPQPTGPEPGAGLGPNRRLALWPYTRLSDPRLDLSGDDYLLVRGTAHADPCKIGYFNSHGWLAYVRAGVVFCKRFTPQPGRPHADFGCNAEVYAGAGSIEIETLGPLAVLAPGQQVTHDETWEIYRSSGPLPTYLAAIPVLNYNDKNS